MAAAAPSLSARAGDGRSLMDVEHILEQRCGREQVNGRWVDAWRELQPFGRAELANQQAEALRAVGFTVRVRPVLR